MPQIYGNTSGLSPSAHKTLERIYRRKVPLEHLATPELIKSLAEATQETGRQVGALVHRSGAIDYVIVGDATKLMLPDIGRLRAAEGRFRALRLVHTHMYNEPLTRDDIVDLVRLRLDMVAAIQLSAECEPKTIEYAYNTPPSPVVSDDEPNDRLPYRRVGPVPIGRIEANFGELISALEDEFAKRSRTVSTTAKDGRAILVHVAEKSKQGAFAQAEDSLRELSELSRTAGVDVADTVIQLREKIDPRLIVGKGKLDDIVLRAAELDAATLVFDRNLNPSQASAIAKHSDLKILDRTQLILDIFAQRAESADGKLQVELAQLKYALPRLSQKDDSLSRLTGGIGGRGPGETKLEIGRRRAKERVSALEDELKKLSRQREQRRRKRSRQGVPIVSIVGYTNAGKSTLLNTLTGSDTIAEDKLFATLDTRSRRLRFPEEREVIITDTVGFIRELPKDLFAAFRATFEETADADLLLHVVDASDLARDQHIATTEELLGELGLASIPRIVVFNKVDLIEPGEARRLVLGRNDAVTTSARDRESTRGLLALIAARLQERWDQSSLSPYVQPTDGDALETSDENVGAATDADGVSMTTLEEMMAGKRYRRTTIRA
ncbi:MAG TPA: GTPase HflX [Polyangium sp.]|nr:GTPase HflX [Polyangium sp.]